MTHMHRPFIGILTLASASLLTPNSAWGQHRDPPPQTSPDSAPLLPEGLTLEQTLDFAANPPPASWPQPVHDNPVLSFTLVELLEYRLGNERRDELGWDTQGWIGNDDHKFWWKSEGAATLNGRSAGDADLQALYAKPLSAFWFLQAGVRYNQMWSGGNTKGQFSGVLGLQGLAPYKFDLEPTLYLTSNGDLLAQLTASYDLYLNQRLVLQPRLEFNLSAQDIPDFGLGAGFNDLSFDLRLRYEIRREFAPYVGVRFTTFLGETADIAELGGEAVDDLQFVFGVRIVF